MTARVVREAYDVWMAGLDHHAGLYYFNLFTGLSVPPAPPVPYPPGLAPWPPFSFHIVYGSSRWWSGDPKANETVIAEGDPIVSKGHEIKRNVHVPPGANLLLPVTWVFSSSKWFIGVSSVIATKGPVASTIAGATGANYNCHDPCSLFLPNVMRATSTVEVQPSAGDYVSAFGVALAQSVFELIISMLLEHKWTRGLWSKLFGKVLAIPVLEKLLQSLEKRMTEALEKKLAAELEKAIAAGVKDPLGYALKKIAYLAFEDFVAEGPRRFFTNVVRGGPVNALAMWLANEGKDLIQEEASAER